MVVPCCKWRSEVTSAKTPFRSLMLPQPLSSTASNTLAYEARPSSGMRRNGIGPSRVQRAVEILIAFEFAEERQHAVPVSAGRRALRPFFIAGQAAHRHHAVDRRRLADHAAWV